MRSPTARSRSRRRSRTVQLARHFPSYGQGLPNLHYVPSPERIIEFARHGLAYALVPEVAVWDCLRSKRLVELVPRLYRLELYWQVYDSQAGLLVDLTRAVVGAARQNFGSNRPLR